ncbi:ABC transporter ATP-binding protein [Thauera sp.]|uniref:ABC transporter ATP-binding protein n=1 Tax=Thauera sp. TaxID=1905334 RepID=UPI0039E3E0FC
MQTQSAPALIECDRLRHSYAGKQVLNGLSFQVRKGGIHGLLGKNGAGKTTTINILMGFLEPSGGSCRVLGDPSHRLRPETRRRIGLLHEGFTQHDFMTIAELEKFYRHFYPHWQPQVFTQLVQKLPVPSSRRLSKLSFGQRSQVCLALVMAQLPELMILDDYSMGLDAGYRRLLLDYLHAYAEEYGTTILLTSHVVQDLERLIDHMFIIQNGSLLYSADRGRFFESLRQWRFRRSPQSDQLEKTDVLTSVEHIGRHSIVCSFRDEDQVRQAMLQKGVMPEEWQEIPLSFEDAFLSLTGKY